MLCVRELRKRFGEVQALDGCSFDVGRGRVLGFLGPNGAGKTTVMRAVFGLVELDAGDVLWGGRPIGPSERLRFGYMPEERGLYPRMPVGEQLAYFGCLHGLHDGAARAAARSWLERRNGDLRLLAGRDVDPEQVLVQAERAGRVVAFSYGPPSLAELFLELVSP
jgi:ABC-2 type transport system ATP-binding protein